jgi:hypothetical protein
MRCIDLNADANTVIFAFRYCICVQHTQADHGGPEDMLKQKELNKQLKQNLQKTHYSIGIAGNCNCGDCMDHPKPQ